MLSQGGRKILIKVVALAIPTFAMSVFKLPITLCEELESLLAKFWWSQKKEERKAHWIGWDKMSRSKFQGSLSFKKLHSFNMALLAKQAWGVVQNEDSLMHPVYKANIFQIPTFLMQI